MPTINSNSFKINKNLITIILFILIGSTLSFIYLKPFLGFKDTMLLRLDWHKEFQLTAATWVSLVKYGEFPFWNPYKGGGNFNFAHPESHVLSPEMLFVLLFGPVKGLYYSVLFFYILSFVGCYFVGKYFRLSFLASLYLAIVFTFSSYVMNNLFMGASMWMMTGYIPFAFYFLMKAQDKWKYGIIAGFFHALIYLGGGIYPFMLFILFTILFAIANFIAKRNLGYIKRLAVMFIFSFLFASIKIFPNIDLYELNKREVGIETVPLKLEILKKAFLDKNQAWDIVSVYWYKDYNFHFPSYGNYIGLVPISLAVIGLLLWFKNIEFVLITFASFLIYLSNYSPFSLIWKIIHAVPPFSSLQRSVRFVIFFALMLSILGAKVISKLDQVKINKKGLGYLKSALIIALILFVFFDLTKASYIISDNFKPWPMQDGLIKWDDKFEYYDFHDRFNLTKEQIAFLDANYLKGWSHVDTLSNKGSKKRAYDPMQINRKIAVSARQDPEYKGEYYFIESNNSIVQLEKWSPNKITLKVKTDKDNLLVINQNFHNLWKIKEGFEMKDYDGLLGIKVPKGEHTVNLYVFQNKIFIGAFLSLIGIILGAYLFINSK